MLAFHVLQEQPITPVNGYLHWSWFLYNRGQAGDDAFTCPEFPNRGTPRTNPGPDQSNWEAGQQDVEGGMMATSASLEDRQAARLAFTGNAAIFPRNKFTREINGGASRTNRLVNESEIKQPGAVILATEFNNNWRAITKLSAGEQSLLSKSHRPVNPFYSLSTGSDEYAVPESTESFTYTGLDSPTRPYGLLPKNICDNSVGLIDSAEIETNAIGRHHPGGDGLGGTVNFMFTDGHVVRKTILQTLKDREWGDKYYALTGNTKVIDRYGDIR